MNSGKVVPELSIEAQNAMISDFIKFAYKNPSYQRFGMIKANVFDEIEDAMSMIKQDPKLGDIFLVTYQDHGLLQEFVDSLFYDGCCYQDSLNPLDTLKQIYQRQYPRIETVDLPHMRELTINLSTDEDTVEETELSEDDENDSMEDYYDPSKNCDFVDSEGKTFTFGTTKLSDPSTSGIHNSASECSFTLRSIPESKTLTFGPAKLSDPPSSVIRNFSSGSSYAPQSIPVMNYSKGSDGNNNIPPWSMTTPVMPQLPELPSLCTPLPLQPMQSFDLHSGSTLGPPSLKLFTPTMTNPLSKLVGFQDNQQSLNGHQYRLLSFIGETASQKFGITRISDLEELLNESLILIRQFTSE